MSAPRSRGVSGIPPPRKGKWPRGHPWEPPRRITHAIRFLALVKVLRQIDPCYQKKDRRPPRCAHHSQSRMRESWSSELTGGSPFHTLAVPVGRCSEPLPEIGDRGVPHYPRGTSSCSRRSEKAMDLAIGHRTCGRKCYVCNTVSPEPGMKWTLTVSPGKTWRSR